MIAEVLVDVKAKAVDKTFDYKVPKDLEPVIEVGQRIHVPFGPRFVMGYVLGLKEDTDIKGLKSIQKIIDLIPSLTPELIELGKSMRQASISPLVSMYQAMLPSALKSRYQKRLKCNHPDRLPEELKGYFNQYQEAPYNDTLDPYLSTIKHLINDGVLDVQYVIEQHGRAQFKTYLKLIDPSIAVRGQKQQAVIDALTREDDRDKQTIMAEANASYSTISSLVKKGIIEEIEHEFYREVEHRYDAVNKRVTYTEEQEQVYQTIVESIQTHNTFLLHGITGSGKTEIYLNVIEDVVNAGKEAIMLVPEISLTPMMTSRFKGRFGDNVALLHSRLSIGEKYDEWRKVRRKEVSVVVGARSAIFAPFENLGVIIIDEEHTDSYKQDSEPRYHAKDVALMRAEYYDIPLILGSATPSVDSYYAAMKGEYTLLKMNNRANKTTLPDVYIEDMRQEFQGGNRTIFSRRLHELIRDRLDKKEQIILLLNRRGHSTFVMCRTCGETVMCPNCDISLTYHEKGDKLKCHYCGHEEWSPAVCPSCGSPHIRYMGIGTEKVEEYVKATYPEARVIRMDADTTTTKNAHEELLYEFEHKGDILIGTQMIAKGLDFPNVTLVGVLAADMSLNLPDYKAIEHTFQLLTQVSGRAGRHDKEGEVVIQTYNPDHYAILHAKDHNYTAFFETEMKIRKISGYTPYTNITQIVLSDKDVRLVLKTGSKLVVALRRELPDDCMVLGPVLPKISRIRQYFRAQIIIKHDRDSNIDPVLQTIYERFYSEIIIAIDKHPNLL
jgi:primosomal protein N' (replication factor Y)